VGGFSQVVPPSSPVPPESIPVDVSEPVPVSPPDEPPPVSLPVAESCVVEPPSCCVKPPELLLHAGKPMTPATTTAPPTTHTNLANDMSSLFGLRDDGPVPPQA